jgi:superfamily II DNA or RNA helicase
VDLPGLLIEVLERERRASVRELLDAVRSAGGRGVSRAAIERALDADGRFVAEDELGRTRWALASRPEAGPEAEAQAGVATRRALTALELRPWQAEALAAWSERCRGVVEAVTGTGKTKLAIAATRLALDRGGRVLVLVPTLELQEQWVREVRRDLPDATVGRLGGGADDDLFACQVLVATPHSAAGVPIDLPSGAVGLVVADEAHRYGAPTWGAALPEDFAMRLAVTATYERGDEGVAEVLEPYFGEVVYRYRYDRAVADGTVAPFAIGLVGVPLDATERSRHEAADRRVRALHRELIGPLGMPREPRALFAAAAAVAATAAGGGAETGGAQAAACREYLARVRERRDVAANAAAKLDVVDAAAAALAGRRSLVFTDTVAQADAAVRRLSSAGVAAETVHGQLPNEQRRIRLAQFRRGRIDALVAPRVLDEGVDVPEADVALVLAAFRTRRQLIQRLGRVLRRKPDGREARLVLAHAIGTAEDPAQGGHGAFLAEVREVARRVDDLDLGTSGELAAWLGARGVR